MKCHVVNDDLCSTVMAHLHLNEESLTKKKLTLAKDKYDIKWENGSLTIGT